MKFCPSNIDRLSDLDQSRSRVARQTLVREQRELADGIIFRMTLSEMQSLACIAHNFLVSVWSELGKEYLQAVKA